MPILRLREIADRLSEIRRKYERSLLKVKELAGESEAYGVDRIAFKLDGFANDFKRELDESISALSYGLVSDEERGRWESTVPAFLREGKFPVFLEADIACRDKLEEASGSKRFDLAYCSNVLYQVHRNQSRDAVESSFEVIYGALAPGGWFFANEPHGSEFRYFDSGLTKVGFEVSMQVVEGRDNYQCRRMI